jgi:hypothetical protein
MPIVTTITPDIRVGAPQTSGALTVFPLLRGSEPSLEYRSFAQAIAEGFIVREVQQGAAVRDLTVVNPLGVPVLLYDGEEVLGAQQNRTLDQTILVPAIAEMNVPVSCVEAGRWDGGHHGDHFAPAPQTAYPALRAMKQHQRTRAVTAGDEARADQNAVWSEVAAKAERRGAASATGAMHDVYEHDRTTIEAIAAAIERQPGQVGAVAIIGGRVAVMDYVSRSDVWAALHGPLVQGYALDALDGRTGGVTTFPDETVDRAWTARWIGGILQTSGFVGGTTAGLGQSVSLNACDVAAAGLVHDDELIQLSAFPALPADSPGASRIRRPSRRG